MDCDPKRLLESSELAPAERSVLQSARTQPARYDVERGLARFRTALSAPPAVPTPTSTLAVGVVTVVTLGLLAGAYFGFARQPEPEPLPPQLKAAAVVSFRPRPMAAAPAPAATPDETPEPSSADLPVFEPMKPPVARKPRRSHPPARPSPISKPAQEAVPEHAAPQPQANPSKSDSSTAIAREPDVQHDDSLDELRATARVRALLGRDPRAALGLLDRLSALHPHGYFVEERAALRVFALLAAGQRDAAAGRARDFLREYPHSPFAAQLRKISEQ